MGMNIRPSFFNRQFKLPAKKDFKPNPELQMGPLTAEPVKKDEGNGGGMKLKPHTPTQEELNQAKAQIDNLINQKTNFWG